MKNDIVNHQHLFKPSAKHLFMNDIKLIFNTSTIYNYSIEAYHLTIEHKSIHEAFSLSTNQKHSNITMLKQSMIK